MKASHGARDAGEVGVDDAFTQDVPPIPSIVGRPLDIQLDFRLSTPGAEDGDQFGMQLERFRCALHVVTKILGCGQLVPSR
eukprot:4559093-Amphidinium_carterae.1